MGRSYFCSMRMMQDVERVLNVFETNHEDDDVKLDRLNFSLRTKYGIDLSASRKELEEYSQHLQQKECALQDVRDNEVQRTASNQTTLKEVEVHEQMASTRHQDAILPLKSPRSLEVKSLVHNALKLPAANGRIPISEALRALRQACTLF